MNKSTAVTDSHWPDHVAPNYPVHLDYSMLMGMIILVILVVGQGLRELDADAMFPYNDLTTVRSDGYAVFSESPVSSFGNDGHNLGDINGDGLDDLVFAQYMYGDTGRVVIVFGTDNSSSTSVSDETAAASPRGFQITSEGTNTRLGTSVASGDYNGDGKTDILVGASVKENSNFVALVWGRDNDSLTDVAVSISMDSSIGVMYTTGLTDDEFGFHVVHLGDFNGDSYDDFAMSAPWRNTPSTSAGRVYVMFGGPSLSSAIMGSSDCLVLIGPYSDAVFGYSLASVDYNNDSLSDLVVGAPYSPIDSTKNGRVYVILGNTTHDVGEMDMAEFVTGDTTGFYIDGEVTDRYLGISVDGGQDVNHDGFQDIIIGSSHVPLSAPGIAVVLFGKASGLEALKADSLASNAGFVVSGGDSNDTFGQEVGFLGFVDDDVYGDYFVTYVNENGNYSTTVFYGRDELSSFTAMEEAPFSQELANTFSAFNAGNHLGPDTAALAFTNFHLADSAGAAYIIEDFVSQFLTPNPTTSPTASPTLNPSGSPTIGPTATPSVAPTMNPTVSPTTYPTMGPSSAPTSTPTSFPTTAPTTAPTGPQCDISISTTGGDGLTWDLTDDEGDEEIASGEFGGEAMDFTLLASEEYLLFLSSDTVPAATSITVTVNGQDTVIPLEQGLTTSTEIAGVTCEAISNKIASIDSGYSSTTTALLALLMVLL